MAQLMEKRDVYRIELDGLLENFFPRLSEAEAIAEDYLIEGADEFIIAKALTGIFADQKGAQRLMTIAETASDFEMCLRKTVIGCQIAAGFGKIRSRKRDCKGSG